MNGVKILKRNLLGKEQQMLKEYFILNMIDNLILLVLYLIIFYLFYLILNIFYVFF